MLDQLLNYIGKQKLFQPEHKILLAISGGIDSMVMLHLFQRTRFKFSIAHCNFQLRGKESDEDQTFVKKTAKECSTDFYTISFATKRYAEQQGISVQMAARALRRKWLSDLWEKESFDVIATAHHLNDSLETVLYNLTRGTGILGLKGILPRSGHYVRPMMFASRDQIHAYAEANDIIWFEDRSNRSIKYHRNLIRHHIIPELKKINPNLEYTFSHTLEKIMASERIYRKEIERQKEWLLENAGDEIRIAKDKLRRLDENQMILFELLEGYGFNYHQVRDIMTGLDSQPGKYFYTNEYRLLVDRKFLIISKQKKEEHDEAVIEVNTHQLKLMRNYLTFEKVTLDKVEFTGNRNIAFFDFDKLRFPLELRKWRHGDRFQPLGMEHKKKLSDFMIDEKIPLNLKEQVLVLTSDKNLVWVVGHRIDDRYKITSQTCRAYKICNRYGDDKSF